MLKNTCAIALSGLLIAAPGFAQTTETTPLDEPMAPVTAPMTSETAPMMIEVPEGYLMTELSTVTADQLKGVNVYDPSDTSIAEISDVQIGPDSMVNGIIIDVGGFLGIGQHQVLLSTDQVGVYKNSDNDIRAYVSMTKDQLKELPEYQEPNQ